MYSLLAVLSLKNNYSKSHWLLYLNLLSISWHTYVTPAVLHFFFTTTQYRKFHPQLQQWVQKHIKLHCVKEKLIWAFFYFIVSISVWLLVYVMMDTNTVLSWYIVLAHGEVNYFIISCRKVRKETPMKKLPVCFPRIKKMNVIYY